MRFISVLVFSFLKFITYAQNNTNAVVQQINNAVNNYSKTVVEKAYLFSGQEYYHNTGKLVGHPFLLADAFTIGNIWYEGNLYNNVPLKLDIVHKELITHSTNTNIQIIIQQEKVDSFTLGSMLFWRLKPDSINKKFVADFYEVLHKGKLTLLARRNKKINETVSGTGVEKKIQVTNEFYFLQNGVYKEIKNRNNFLNFFGDSRNAVANQMSKLDISYNSNTEKYIVESVKFYEELNN